MNISKKSGMSILAGAVLLLGLHWASGYELYCHTNPDSSSTKIELATFFGDNCTPKEAELAVERYLTKYDNAEFESLVFTRENESPRYFTVMLRPVA